MESIPFKPHSQKQQDLIFSDSEITIGATGTQWGKSQGGTLWIKRQLHTYTDKKDNFIIGAPTYKILQQSIIPYFLNHMTGIGKYRSTDAIFEMKRGGTVYFRTETDPDSIVGIPNVKAGWLDEAGKLRRYFFENYQARAAAKGAKTLLTTSPYSRNWLFKDYIQPKTQGKLPHVKLIQAASWENPFHTLHDPEKRAKARTEMDPRRFDMIFGGEWGQMSGLVFDCFDEDQHTVAPFELPYGTIYIGGVDWGYTEPFVHVVRAITPDGRHYQVSEFYKSGMTPHKCLDLIEEKTKVFGIKRHWCGHEQPGLIQELNQRKVAAQPADFDITRGNGLHYQLITQGKYKVFQGSSPNTLDEYATYHYPDPKDLDSDQDSKELKPVGQYDHAMSANRFISIHEFRSELKRAPKSPSDGLKHNPEKRLEYLKRRPRNNRAERWSESDGGSQLDD
jgi:phage terminase large subunit